jgi:NADH-quinone oxidoreductase subunit N
VPPLAGFVGKLALFAATIEAGYAWLAVLAAANSVLSLAYYLRVLGPAYLGEPGPEVGMSMGPWARTGTYIPAAALLVLGIAAQPLWHAFLSAGLYPH